MSKLLILLDLIILIFKIKLKREQKNKIFILCEYDQWQKMNKDKMTNRIIL